jgi:hypothetical protein
MGDFLGDYDQGKREGRYVPAQLPDLPFASGSFEIALCSHFLFFYADTLSAAFHRQAVDELCRVAREVRIFPLLTYNAEPCLLVDSITADLKQAGRTVLYETVPYEFQRGGNMMLRVLNGME